MRHVSSASEEVNFQQPESRDRELELDIGLRAEQDLADFLGGDCLPREWVLPDERIGPGGDEFYALLRGGLHRRAAGGALRLRIGSRRSDLVLVDGMPLSAAQTGDGVSSENVGDDVACL